MQVLLKTTPGQSHAEAVQELKEAIQKDVPDLNSIPGDELQHRTVAKAYTLSWQNMMRAATRVFEGEVKPAPVQREFEMNYRELAGHLKIIGQLLMDGAGGSGNQGAVILTNEWLMQIVIQLHYSLKAAKVDHTDPSYVFGDDANPFAEMLRDVLDPAKFVSDYIAKTIISAAEDDAPASCDVQDCPNCWLQNAAKAYWKTNPLKLDKPTLN